MIIYGDNRYIVRQKLGLITFWCFIIGCVLVFLSCTYVNAKEKEADKAGLGIWENVPEFTNLILEENLFDTTRSEENLYSDACYVFGSVKDIEEYLERCKEYGYSNIKSEYDKTVEGLSFHIFHATNQEQKEILLVIEQDINEMGFYGMQVYAGTEELPESILDLAFWWEYSAEENINALGCGKYAYTPTFPMGTKFALRKHWLYEEYPDVCENCVFMDYEQTKKYIDSCKKFGYQNIIDFTDTENKIYFVAYNEDGNYIRVEWKKEKGCTWVAARKNKLPNM